MGYPATPTAEVDPISRIEGHLGIAVTTDGSGNVTEAYAHGNLWRGFENFLLGRAVNDAITFTQRICGVCPVPHGLASTHATDAVLNYSASHITFATTAAPVDAYGIPPKAVLIRNLILGAEFLMSSITHFYHLAAPSYVQGPHMAPWTPYFADGYYHAALLSAGHGVDDGTGHGVAPLRTAPTAATPDVYSADVWSAVIFSYVKALRVRRLTFEAGALFAGRMPMTSAFIGGGVTFDGTEDLTKRIQKYTALMAEVGKFTLQEYIPIVLALKYLYPDCDNPDNGGINLGAHKGAGGGLGRFLSWGGFPGIDGAGTLAIKGGVYDGGVTFTAGNKAQVAAEFLGTGANSVKKNLTEDIESSRYAIASQDTAVYGVNGLGTAGAATAAYPGAVSRTKPKRDAANGYTYMKAPRWGGKSMEVGPLARLVVNGIYKIDGTLLQNMGGFLGTALSTALYLKTVGANTGLDPKLVSADIAVALFRAKLATLWYAGTQYSIDGSIAGTTALPNVNVTAVYGDASTVIAGPILAVVTSIAGGISTLDRLRARALESAYLITNILGLFDKSTGTFPGGWDAQLQALTGTPAKDFVGSTWRNLPIPPGTKQGWGAVEAPRGALMHQATIVGGKITKYQCIVPTTWNGSPRTTTGTTYRGAIEESCIGSPYNGHGDTTFAGQAGSVVAKSGVEMMRIAQSFDPCIACAIH